ncbi:MAG: DUF1449 family protein [Cyclobacteriaceae bacterium]
MSELLAFAFSGVNIIPTILFIFILFYWLISIIGIVDVDSIDLDLDIDAEANAELGGAASVLSFFNIGHMPLMVFLTFYTIPLWMLTLIGNDFLGFESFLTGLVVFIPSLIVCLFIAKFLTIPVALFYRKLKTQTEAVGNIIGKICTAKLPINSEQKAQAEIKVGGTSVLINVKTRDGLKVEKGSSALVIDFQEEKNFYYVEPYQA